MADDTKADETKDDKDASADKPKPRAKPRTRTQIARDKAASEAKAREASILETSPLWQVIYPTGISINRPDDDEIIVDVNGIDTDVEVINGFAHIPMNGRVRAGSLDELSNFSDLAGQGMLRQVLESAS